MLLEGNDGLPSGNNVHLGNNQFDRLPDLSFGHHLTPDGFGSEKTVHSIPWNRPVGAGSPRPSRRRSSPSRITTSKAKFSFEISVLQVRQSVLPRKNPGSSGQ